MASRPIVILPAARPERYATIEFMAFKVSERTKPAFNLCGPWQRTYELGPVQAASLDEAVNAAITTFTLSHKQHLLIREAGEHGVHFHLYAIKRRSSPRKVYRDYAYRNAHDLYPEIVCSIDAGVLA